MNNDCLFCHGHVEEDGLVAPFPYADDEYPKPYGRVCATCLKDCNDKKHTKEEFVQRFYTALGEVVVDNAIYRMGNQGPIIK